MRLHGFFRPSTVFSLSQHIKIMWRRPPVLPGIIATAMRGRVLWSNELGLLDSKQRDYPKI